MYNSQIGVNERGGNNRGPEVKQYLASVNLSEGYAWCGAFANWVMKQCGMQAPKGAAMAMAWFPNSKTIWKRSRKDNATPQRGDLFALYYNSLGRIGHVGFIEKWDYGDGYAITVEGNTNDAGSREGDGVYRKRRLIRQLYAVSDWITASGGGALNL
ncbi:CHAP domain-containing protein [Pontibacter ummariensis]|uniref:CHAP domain-containing protein n=1 Tax=Pontibacter ummariensis TaxID=1610492 RepID=A0A239HK54_9BACT|nr:CHAP domain-containing protein [Pontibacter ummariensis]SNS81203.1 CHAP domain-containing protein [Pontibacter ummariensis]